MGRTGRVIVILCIMVGCMTGLWLFQSWREGRVTKETKELHNVYVTGVEGKQLKGIWEKKECQWELLSELSDPSVAGVADLVFTDQKIVKIRRKPETIQGKYCK